MKPLNTWLLILAIFTGCKSEELPVVTTDDVVSITQTSATCAGEVISEGDSYVTEKGICWSKSENPTIQDSINKCGLGAGSFSCELTNLTPNTEYYIRAYATNSYGTGYGKSLSFTTDPLYIPELRTYLGLIKCHSASIGGEILYDGGSPVIDCGLCWSNSDNPTLNDSYLSIGTSSDSFRETITGLESNTDYYVRPYASNIIGTGYGPSIKITTCLDINPNPINPQSVALHLQPLDTIKKYIHGRWQIVVIKGGIDGQNTCYNNYTSEFTDNDLFITNVYAIAYDTFNITWVKKKLVNSPDSLYLMTLQRLRDGVNMDVSYVMQEIKNDTLVYYEYQIFDALYYHGLKNK
ncbi:MAG: hypothetical protein WCE64_05865 [Bacteroidales bacterium]